MSLIEKLEKELGSANALGVTTMEDVTYQERLAAQSLVLDFRIASTLIRADLVVALADGAFDDEIDVTLH